MIATALAGFLGDRLGVSLGTTVAELGATDASVTRALAATGARTIVVEPVLETRARLARAVPSVEIVEGNGLDMPLPPWGADAVVWIDPPHAIDAEAATREARRVLAPEGVLVLVSLHGTVTVDPWRGALGDGGFGDLHHAEHLSAIDVWWCAKV